MNKNRRELADDILAILCRRLIEIDPTCDKEHGCPFDFVAEPMIVSFRNRCYPLPTMPFSMVDFRKYLESMPDTLQRLVGVDGQGRACEIHEVQSIAREFLEKRKAA